MSTVLLSRVALLAIVIGPHVARAQSPIARATSASPDTRAAAAREASLSSAPSSTLRDPFLSPRREITARAKAGPPPAAPALVATSLIVSGEKSVATLRGSGRFVVVGIGDWIDGWRVIAVTQDGVSLRYGAGDDGAVSRLALERFSRKKGGKTTSTMPQDASYVSGSGAALPGGDIPLLPETSPAQAARGPADQRPAELQPTPRSHAPSGAPQVLVPRLVPTP